MDRARQAERAASAREAADKCANAGNAGTANLMTRLGLAHQHFAEGHASAKVGAAHCPDCRVNAEE